MFNIGFTEFLVIGVVALLVIGPKQLPEVARVVGRLLSELKKATQDLSGGLLEVTQEVKESIEDTRDEILKEGNDLLQSANPLNEDHFDDHHHEDQKDGEESQKDDGQ